MLEKDKLSDQLDSIMTQIMTTEEAAMLWNLSQDRIKALCASGQVIASKRGKTWLILKEQDNPKQRNKD
ncbi:helix-turn-helix domain-containing protein [Paenibacillus sp. FSL R7-0163]|uniref:helix-turn-helix domain-containing protein n=1 Tax=Paenibacillus sp. FSL R7-0163 TaxID=2954530 RepID=UPI0030DB19D4